MGRALPLEVNTGPRAAAPCLQRQFWMCPPHPQSHHPLHGADRFPPEKQALGLREIAKWVFCLSAVTGHF